MATFKNLNAKVRALSVEEFIADGYNKNLYVSSKLAQSSILSYLTD